MIWQCNSCGGTYSDTCAGGLAYYHACPPLTGTIPGPLADQPNKRDENLASTARGTTRAIKAEGLGRTLAELIPPPAPPPPEEPGIFARLWKTLTGG
jgi:hypothetical protein